MVKETTKDIFNNEVEKFHGKLISFIRGLIFDLKIKHGLSDNEISEIFNIDEKKLSNFMHENWDGYVDSRFLSILYLLCNEEFDFYRVLYKTPADFAETIEEYIKQFTVSRRERNINELFEILGIEDDYDLEMAISAIKEILHNKKDNGKDCKN